MAKPFQRFRQFLAELKRRKVYRVAAGYLVAAFVVLQLAGLAADAFGFPGWFEPMVWVVAGLGFPIALVLAWAFEVTPKGVRRTTESEPGAEGAGEPVEKVAAGYKVLVSLGLLAAAAGGGWYLTGGGGGPSADVTEGTVAVLPFTISGSSDTAWHDGMVSLLTTGVDGAGGLRGIPDRTVLAEWEQRETARREASTPDALAVARAVGAQYAVVGSATGAGSELQLSATIHATRPGDRLGQVAVRGSKDSVADLADTLSRRILGVLLEEGDEGLPSVDLRRVTTGDLEALKLYLDGLRHARDGELPGAIEDFEAAARKDSTFALPHADIALTGFWGHQSQLPAVRRAHELARRLPVRKRRLVRALHIGRIQRRTLAARDSLRLLTRDYPDDPSMWNSRGEFVAHEWIPRGIRQVEEAHERAVALDPGHTAYYDHYVVPAFTLHHDSALAAERIEAMPAGAWKDGLSTAHRFVFGSEESREGALTRLVRTEVPEEWGPAPVTVFGVTDLDLLDTYLRTKRERGDMEALGIEGWLLINDRRRGKLNRLWSNLRESNIQSGSVAPLLAFGMTLRMPVPDSLASTYLARERLPADPTLDHLLAHGLYLIEDGRGEQLGQLTSSIRTKVDTTGPSPVSAGRAGAVIRELRGYRAFRRGHLEEAARLADRSNEAAVTGAIWRGDLYRELGQLERAEGWYLAAWYSPVAHERLGRLYEEMGRPEDAAAAYRRFAEAWDDADEALQPPVEEARERLEALTAEDDG